MSHRDRRFHPNREYVLEEFRVHNVKTKHKISRGLELGRGESSLPHFGDAEETGNETGRIIDGNERVMED